MQLVSVIMSVYNGERYIERAIKSVLLGTFSNIEIIVIDDASTDQTGTLLRKLAGLDSRVRVITNEKNMGLTKNLNRALKLSRGKFIARLDADDLSYSDRILTQVTFLNNHPEVGIVGTWGDIINSSGNKTGILSFPTIDAEIRTELIKYNPFIHSSIMVRKTIFDAVGGYDESYRYAQDYELYFRISKVAELANIPKALVAHRFTRSSITVKKNKEQIKSVIRVKVKYITEGLYPISAYRYIVKPILSILLPVSVKRVIKKYL